MRRDEDEIPIVPFLRLTPLHAETLKKMLVLFLILNGSVVWGQGTFPITKKCICPVDFRWLGFLFHIVSRLCSLWNKCELL